MVLKKVIFGFIIFIELFLSLYLVFHFSETVFHFLFIKDWRVMEKAP